MAGIFSRFIFNNAIFNTDGEATSLDIIHGSNDKWSKDWRTDYENEAYKAKKRAQEDEITRLRLEAQDNLLRQRELKDENNKQSLRQMLALKRESEQLHLDIQKNLLKLLELQNESVINKNNLAFIVLSMATPFGGLRMQ
jgi:hypothetical protein